MRFFVVVVCVTAFAYIDGLVGRADGDAGAGISLGGPSIDIGAGGGQGGGADIEIGGGSEADAGVGGGADAGGEASADDEVGAGGELMAGDEAGAGSEVGAGGELVADGEVGAGGDAGGEGGGGGDAEKGGSGGIQGRIQAFRRWLEDLPRDISKRIDKYMDQVEGMMKNIASTPRQMLRSLIGRFRGQGGVSVGTGSR